MLAVCFRLRQPCDKRLSRRKSRFYPEVNSPTIASQIVTDRIFAPSANISEQNECVERVQKVGPPKVLLHS